MNKFMNDIKQKLLKKETWKKFASKLKQNILKYDLIVIGLFLLLSFILYLINIRFRLWFIITVVVILGVAFIIGFIQWALRQSTIMKLVSILTAAFFTMFCLLFSKYIVMIFQFLPEHVNNLDGKKYVAVVKSFKNVDVSYYNYYGPLLMGTKEKVHGNFGNGGYDPFENPDTPNSVKYTYYDNKGNVINEKTVDFAKDKNGKIVDKDEHESYDDTEFKEEDYYVLPEDLESIYEKKFGKEIIRVSITGYVLAQRMGVSVLKSTDGGKTFDYVTDEDIIVSREAKAKFLNKKQGFVISTGNIWLDGHSNDVYVTNDGGKTFTPAKFNYTHEGIQFITVEKLPYLKNNTLHLKCSMYASKSDGTGYEDIPLDFISTDDGLTWNLSE